MVLLRHEQADGSWHYDWLLARPGEPEGRLVSFRVSDRVDAGAVAVFDAEAMADHRREYLEYEGEVSGGRGMVVRVARGRCVLLERGGGRARVRGDWGSGLVEWVGVERGEAWEFRRVEPGSVDAGW